MTRAGLPLTDWRHQDFSAVSKVMEVVCILVSFSLKIYEGKVEACAVATLYKELGDP